MPNINATKVFRMDLLPKLSFACLKDHILKAIKRKGYFKKWYLCGQPYRVGANYHIVRSLFYLHYSEIRKQIMTSRFTNYQSPSSKPFEC